MTESERDRMLKKLFWLAEKRAEKATHELNGANHPNLPLKAGKPACAAEWCKNKDAVERHIEDVARKLGLTVEYDGLYPVFTAKDGRQIYCEEWEGASNEKA